MLCWEKQKPKKPTDTPNKSEPLTGVVAGPEIKTAREWFDTIDVDRSGELDGAELAELYRRARGEKLSKAMLGEAMAQMDTGGDGKINFGEFEVWWGSNGGDLEAQRERALTVAAGRQWRRSPRRSPSMT